MLGCKGCTFEQGWASGRTSGAWAHDRRAACSRVCPGVRVGAWLPLDWHYSPESDNFARNLLKSPEIII
ncbi:hypothetical protein CRG98_024665 [Punica granatum]|uniref:Uncharacterized protein n=1 Tax=Punica granatum TaxID=22663 RepID=A0A2I0JFA0_PUNGR|nr:hypothetical protein CRG98_024665 [Punica granatum]